jgi:molybdenum cofactor cytidylyltransferase
MLAAAILAAGESRRMGTPKALLVYRGRTFLEHLRDVVRHPRVGLVRVVLGAHAEQIRNRIKLPGSEVVINPDWPSGQLTSIQAALRSLPPEIEGLLVCLVDHPLISPALVEKLIQHYDAGAGRIVVPTFRGRRGHPIIFAASYFPELFAAPKEIGARAVVRAHSDVVIEVPTEEEGVVLNLNDPDAFREAIGNS